MLAADNNLVLRLDLKVVQVLIDLRCAGRDEIPNRETRMPTTMRCESNTDTRPSGCDVMGH